MSGGVPPSSRAGRRTPGRRKAALLYEQFTGHDARSLGEVTVPPLPSEVAVIGHCTAICYRTVRDGVEEDYIHEFAKKDQPLFTIAPNGRQILLVGGRYVFTERGIVDMSDRKNLPAHLRKR